MSKGTPRTPAKKNKNASPPAKTEEGRIYYTPPSDRWGLIECKYKELHYFDGDVSNYFVGDLVEFTPSEEGWATHVIPATNDYRRASHGMHKKARSSKGKSTRHSSKRSR